MTLSKWEMADLLAEAKAEREMEEKRKWHKEIREPLPHFADIRDPEPEDRGGGWSLVLIVVGAVLAFAALVWFAPDIVSAALGASLPTDALLCIENGGCRAALKGGA